MTQMEVYRAVRKIREHQNKDLLNQARLHGGVVEDSPEVSNEPLTITKESQKAFDLDETAFFERKQKNG